MNKPHVDKLYYKMILKDNVDYKKASPVSDENDIFKMTASVDDGVVFTMKEHFDTEHEARQVTDQYLEEWRILMGLKTDPDEITFAYHHADIVDLDPNSNLISVSSTLIARFSIGKPPLHVSRHEYIAPPKSFSTTSTIKTMYLRYKDYQEGNEKLLSMANFIRTTLEQIAAGNGRRKKKEKAAQKYKISTSILYKLGGFCTNRGDQNEARKFPKEGSFKPLTLKEISWIEAVCKIIIKRVGEYEFCPDGLQQITMADLPPLN